MELERRTSQQGNVDVDIYRPTEEYDRDSDSDLLPVSDLGLYEGLFE